MASIVGGIERSGGTATSEERLAEGLLRCMGRWGLAKTTIEDIAREAGMSRATAYRLFPGGKTAILDAAMAGEIRRLVALVELEAAASEDHEDCLVRIVSTASGFLDGNDALRFVREHEPVVFEQYLGFDRVEALFVAAAELLEPTLTRYFAPHDARPLGVWLARLVLSYLQTPSAQLDLTHADDARRLVRTFVLPGLPPLTDD